MLDIIATCAILATNRLSCDSDVLTRSQLEVLAPQASRQLYDMGKTDVGTIWVLTEDGAQVSYPVSQSSDYTGKTLEQIVNSPLPKTLDPIRPPVLELGKPRVSTQDQDLINQLRGRY